MKVEINKITEELIYLDHHMEETAGFLNVNFNIFGRSGIIGNITVFINDDDWLNHKGKVRQYERGNRPEFLSFNNDFDELYSGEAQHPLESSDYIYIENKSGEKSVLVEGRLAEINELCLDKQYNEQKNIKEIFKQLSSQLATILKVDYFIINTLNTLESDRQDQWNFWEERQNEEGFERVIFWGIPTFDLEWFKEYGFVESLNKVLVGKASLVNSYLLGMSRRFLEKLRNNASKEELEHWLLEDENI